jgi:hypothetical protein
MTVGARLRARRVVADLPAFRTTPVLEPLPLPPARHSQRLAVPADALPPPLLVVDVGRLTNVHALLTAEAAGGAGQEPLCPPELCVRLALAGGGAAGPDAPELRDDAEPGGADAGAAAGAGAGAPGGRARLWVRTRAVPAVPALEPPQDEEPAAVGVRAGGAGAAGGGADEGGGQPGPPASNERGEGQGEAGAPAGGGAGAAAGAAAAGGRGEEDGGAGLVERETPGAVAWGERLLLELPPGAEQGEVAVEVRARRRRG